MYYNAAYVIGVLLLLLLGYIIQAITAIVRFFFSPTFAIIALFVAGLALVCWIFWKIGKWVDKLMKRKQKQS